MKNKITLKFAALVSLLTCLFISAAVMMTACVNTIGKIEPHDVEIVLINPHTGEPMKTYGEQQLEVPRSGTPIEVKIKDLVTGEYLTDDDLPETTIADSLSIGIVRYLDWDYNGSAIVQNRFNTWPEFEAPYLVYKIAISFDCRPDNPENPREFQRKYKMENTSFWFEYI